MRFSFFLINYCYFLTKFNQNYLDKRKKYINFAIKKKGKKQWN